MRIRQRAAGATSELRSKAAQDHRNETIHDIVGYVSFGDVRSYIVWLTRKHPDLMDESLK